MSKQSRLIRQLLNNGIIVAGVEPGAGVQRAGGGAVTPWYLAGGAPTPTAAWQAHNAADQATSYVNLVTPGTNDLTVGGAPAWDTVNGWKFTAASSMFLKTGIAPSTNTTIVWFFTNYTAGQFGVYESAALAAAYIPSFTSKRNYYIPDGKAYGSGVTSGCMVSAGNQCYYNGVLETGAMPGGLAGPCSFGFDIGARARSSTTADQYMTCYITAVACYATQLTAPQILAIYNAGVAKGFC